MIIKYEYLHGRTYVFIPLYIDTMYRPLTVFVCKTDQLHKQIWLDYAPIHTYIVAYMFVISYAYELFYDTKS